MMFNEDGKNSGDRESRLPPDVMKALNKAFGIESASDKANKFEAGGNDGVKLDAHDYADFDVVKPEFDPAHPCCQYHVLAYVIHRLVTAKGDATIPASATKALASGLADLSDTYHKMSQEGGDGLPSGVVMLQGPEELVKHMENMLREATEGKQQGGGQRGKDSRRAGVFFVEDGTELVDDNGNMVKLTVLQTVEVSARLFGSAIAESDELLTIWKEVAAEAKRRRREQREGK